MPNHVINEVIIKVAKEKQENVLSKILNADEEIDFEILLPIPLNCWQGGLGTLEKQVSPFNWYDWCIKNWGTKWNAYGQDMHYENIVQEDNKLTLTFQTAWSPPYGWLIALFNSFEYNIEVVTLDEGDGVAIRHYFVPYGRVGRRYEKEEITDEKEITRLMNLIYHK